jgi:hypothetical protein
MNVWMQTLETPCVVNDDNFEVLTEELMKI